MTRILAFTPYTLWDLHTDYEVTITAACQERGAEVTHIRCDGLFHECDMSDANISPTGRPPEFCQMCQSRGDTKFAGMNLTQVWFSRYLEPSEQQEAERWAQELPVEALRDARFREFPVAEWVTSSLVSYFRTFPIRLDDPNVVRIFRKFLQAGAVTCMGMTRALDQHQPDAMVIFNARRSVTYIAFLLARTRGIRVLVHERPPRPGTIYAVENEHCLSQMPSKRLWEEWGEVPLSQAQMKIVADWLRDRRFGRNQKGIHRFSDAPGQAEAVRRKLNLQAGRKLVVLFTSATDEFAGTPGFTGPYPSQEVWIERIVAWAAERSSCDLVIRIHPCLAGVAGGGEAPTQIQWFQELRTHLPENVRLVMPDDPLSSYDLADLADLGITYGSTIGLEMFACGTPVVTTPPLANYDQLPGMISITDPRMLHDELDRGLTLPVSREYRRYAFRCLYRYFFHLALPFPLVSVTRISQSQRNFTHAASLCKGKDESLDRICGFLLHNEPIHAAPTPEQRVAFTRQENNFLTWMEKNPRWLKMGRIGMLQTHLQARRETIGTLPYFVGKHISPRLFPLLRRGWRALPVKVRRAFGSDAT